MWAVTGRNTLAQHVAHSKVGESDSSRRESLFKQTISARSVALGGWSPGRAPRTRGAPPADGVTGWSRGPRK
jgi:hypothetical protein